MTAPKKKKAAPKKKPQTGPTKAATAKAGVSPEQVEDARETLLNDHPIPEGVYPPIKNPYAGKKREDFTIGTFHYGEVVKLYNSIHGTGWNSHRVPPFVFTNMLIHLDRYYKG
jgi:hypothetical protein